MPSGRVHSAVTLTTAVLLSCYDPIMAAGAASGVLLSPDLDCDLGYIGFAKLRSIRFIGGPAAFVWEWWWKPYSIFVPHRSPTSHAPIISTIIRICYLAIPFFVANIFIDMTIPSWLGRAIIGLIIVDCLHILLDAFMKGQK